MVIDSSALVALLLSEPEADRIESAIANRVPRFLSAANLLETSIVVENRSGREMGMDLDHLLYTAEIEVVPVDRELTEIARQAWRRYGKGRHPAALNFGDCFAYALAKKTGSPLLFVGNDFAQTDIEAVL